MLRAIWGQVRRKVGDVARRYNPIQGIYGANIGGNFIPLRDGLIDPGFISRSERAARRFARRQGPNKTTWEQLTLNFDPPPPAPSTPIGRGARQTHFDFGDGAVPRSSDGAARRRSFFGFARRKSRPTQGSARPTQGSARPTQAPPNQTAASARSVQQYDGPIGPQPFDPIDADVRAFKGMREAYRARRRANQGWLASGYGAAADFFTAKDLPEALRGAAQWRRGIAAGAAGLVGIGIGTRALDAAFNRSRYY